MSALRGWLIAGTVLAAPLMILGFQVLSAGHMVGAIGALLLVIALGGVWTGARLHRRGLMWVGIVAWIPSLVLWFLLAVWFGLAWGLAVLLCWIISASMPTTPTESPLPDMPPREA